MRAGLADPVLDAQRVFRTVLDAMAHPGRIARIGLSLDAPPALHRAAAAICLTLADVDTPIWLDGSVAGDDAVGYLRFHCGMPTAESPGAARFALIGDARSIAALDMFDAGTFERPDCSATVIVQVDALHDGSGRRLTGPGIADACLLDVRGVPETFWSAWRANHAAFPCGVDVIFTAGDAIAGLPRTTRVGD